MGDYRKPSIKEWALEDRPREKFLRKGISSLSDAELIAVLIGSGTTDESAVELSRRLLQMNRNNLNELAKLSVDDLTRIKGIGKAKAISIIAALELGRRRKLSTVIEKQKIGNSRDVFDLFQPLVGDIPHEEFWILYLNRSNRIIDRLKLSQGGISGTVIDVRLIIKEAIQKLASSIILCHNHPSGNLSPSEADRKITGKLKEAAALMDMQVLDHVIVSDSGYFSFADEGLL